MKPSNTDAVTQSNPLAAASTQSPQVASQAPQIASIQGASVPISVYRELAAELQTTRAMVNVLNANNQRLTQQNQTLRQEVGRIIQYALDLRQVVEPAPSGNPDAGAASSASGSIATDFIQPSFTQPEADRPTLEAAAAASRLAAKLRGNDDALLSDTLFTEITSSPSVSQTTGAKKLNSLWLTLSIIIVIITAFGVGFLAVRPLLQSRR